jgi:hypothetical protein
MMSQAVMERQVSQHLGPVGTNGPASGKATGTGRGTPGSGRLTGASRGGGAVLS